MFDDVETTFDNLANIKVSTTPPRRRKALIKVLGAPIALIT